MSSPARSCRAISSALERPGPPPRARPRLDAARALPRLAAVAAVMWLAPEARAITLIGKGADWKYLATPAAPDPAWMQVGFGDGSWPSGPGILGYGESYIATQVPFGPDATHKYRSTYFRATFTVGSDPSAFISLSLGANYDDGFVAYINGVEVTRRSMPAGAESYSTLAINHEGGAYESIDLTGAIGALVQGQNLLAVEVHQSSDASSDLVMDVELTATDVPRVVRGPYLQIGAPTGVRVRWRTDAPTDSRVRLGPAADDLATSFDDPTATREHEIEVSGLTPGTAYFYAVGASVPVLAAGDSVRRFVASPPPGIAKPSRIWVLGDSGRPGPDAAAVRDAYAAYTAGRATDLWLMLGDNAYETGTDAEYQAAVFDVYGTMLGGSVLWPTRGNHDGIYAGPANDYYDIFSLPTSGEAGGLASGSEAYYSFDFANVHFVCLDSEGSDRSLSGPMLRWLRDDLAASDRAWNVAFWHHPPYTRGSHDSDDPLDSGGRMRDMRMNALPILDSAGVDLVLTGHSHSYERSFLLNGHYGVSTTLTSAMKVDSGDGRMGGDGPYAKPSASPGPFEGAVYTVAGSSSQTGGGLLDHPVMVASLDALGSLVLEVGGERLDARFLSSAGAVLDSFTVLKGSAAGVEGDIVPSGLRLALAGANPASRETRLELSLPRAGRARLALLDAGGRRVATLLDGFEPPGARRVVWRSLDSRGRSAPAGVYFAMLEFGGERRVVKVVRSR